MRSFLALCVVGLAVITVHAQTDFLNTDTGSFDSSLVDYNGVVEIQSLNASQVNGEMTLSTELQIPTGVKYAAFFGIGTCTYFAHEGLTGTEETMLWSDYRLAMHADEDQLVEVVGFAPSDSRSGDTVTITIPGSMIAWKNSNCGNQGASTFTEVSYGAATTEYSATLSVEVYLYVNEEDVSLIEQDAISSVEASVPLAFNLTTGSMVAKWGGAAAVEAADFGVEMLAVDVTENTYSYTFRTTIKGDLELATPSLHSNPSGYSSYSSSGGASCLDGTTMANPCVQVWTVSVDSPSEVPSVELEFDVNQHDGAGGLISMTFDGADEEPPTTTLAPSVDGLDVNLDDLTFAVERSMTLQVWDASDYTELSGDSSVKIAQQLMWTLTLSEALDAEFAFQLDSFWVCNTPSLGAGEYCSDDPAGYSAFKLHGDGLNAGAKTAFAFARAQNDTALCAAGNFEQCGSARHVDTGDLQVAVPLALAFTDTNRYYLEARGSIVESGARRQMSVMSDMDGAAARRLASGSDNASGKGSFVLDKNELSSASQLGGSDSGSSSGSSSFAMVGLAGGAVMAVVGVAALVAASRRSKPSRVVAYKAQEW